MPLGSLNPETKKARQILQSGIYKNLTKAVPSKILLKILYIPDCKISLAFFVLYYIFTYC